MYFPTDYFRSNFSSIQTLTLRFSGYLWILFPKNATEYKSCKWVFLKELDRTVSFIVSDFRVCNWVILKVRFQLVSSGMRIGRMGMIRIIGIWNRKNRIVLKMDWKTLRRFSADALLFWSADLTLPSDLQLFHFVHSAPNRRIHGMP